MTALAVLDRMPCCALDLALNRTWLYAGCIDTRIAVLDVNAVLGPITSAAVAVPTSTSIDNVAVSVHLSDVAQFYGRHLGFVVSTVLSCCVVLIRMCSTRWP